MKVESVERRDSACCYARRRRERLTDACVACSMQSGRVCEVLACANETLFPFSLHTPPSSALPTNAWFPTATRPRCRSPKPKSAMATQCCPQSRLTQRNAVRRNVAKLTARSKPPVAVKTSKSVGRQKTPALPTVSAPDRECGWGNSKNGSDTVSVPF